MVDKYTTPKNPIVYTGKSNQPSTPAQFPSGNDAEHRTSIVPSMSDVAREAVSRRNANRSLIDNAFPSQGMEQRSHEGSQSMSPNKDYQ